MFLDTAERRLKEKLPVRSHMYDICSERGCMLFGKNDTETKECLACKAPRFSELDLKPIKQMKMLSIGDHISRMLASEDLRALMRYRHNYVHEENVYRDYFDGEEYKNFKQNTTFFDGEDDVALALFVDGFRPGKGNKGSKLTIIHLLNLNIPPHYR